MACRRSSAANNVCTLPKVSALAAGRPNHFFQKLAGRDSSQEFKLPSLAQNNTKADFTSGVVGMRGWRRWS